MFLVPWFWSPSPLPTPPLPPSRRCSPLMSSRLPTWFRTRHQRWCQISRLATGLSNRCVTPCEPEVPVSGRKLFIFQPTIRHRTFSNYFALGRESAPFRPLYLCVSVRYLVRHPGVSRYRLDLPAHAVFLVRLDRIIASQHPVGLHTASLSLYLFPFLPLFLFASPFACLYLRLLLLIYFCIRLYRDFDYFLGYFVATRLILSTSIRHSVQLVSLSVSWNLRYRSPATTCSLCA